MGSFVRSILSKTGTLLSVYYAYMVEYRAELILWVLSGSLPLILMGVWMEAAQGGQFGLTPVDFVRYFLAVFLVRQFTVVWVIWDFEREVVEGRLSFRLLQPLDPGWHYFATHFAERFARIPFAIFLIGLFFLIYPQAFWIPDPISFCLAMVAILMAFALRFMMQYTFSMLAFWMERASAIEQFWLLFYLFLSGLIAPLEMFPPVVRTVVQWTPFPYMINFPASLLVGMPVNVLQGFGMTILWFLIFLGLNRWLWRLGLRQYSGMGA
ncbi:MULTISPECIES: ABC-2 family transporter protein [unclassified Leptolyngbya]|uniref:ABC transporter permease n=1 Tax=unclassified Leptolyngbya TaxID=2650499 RepID=UPI0016860557|nr:MULTISPECIES: ABC-2 family transporter protein [unclassified Leptolyngbya]MBD1913550.1 ABC-2 family transporter protein [Leptolyngbya sp. FACHB-8]MBD2155879.1 ABC-2 family transporter protein [Leptolyngbya sp. FACHB-16]